LTEKLAAEGIQERNLYWVNQYGLAPRWAVIFASRFEKIVALGSHAQMWCGRHGLNARAIHHPQYWRRFHNHETYQIGEAIKRPYAKL
jgi:hypothetical protein